MMDKILHVARMNCSTIIDQRIRITNSARHYKVLLNKNDGRLLFISTMASITFSTTIGASPLEGSSININLLSLINARAMDSICFDHLKDVRPPSSKISPNQETAPAHNFVALM